MRANGEALVAACKGKEPREVRALFKSDVHNTSLRSAHESALSLAGLPA